MKKIIAMMLATGIMYSCFAQYNRTTEAVPNNMTQRSFNYPAPGKLQTSFHFLLGKGNRMVLELSDITQLYTLANPDSILKIVWKALQPFRDSLAKPLVNRRIDYTFTLVDEKVRIIEYPQAAEIYSIKGNDITQLKVEQDTLRINLRTNAAGIIPRNIYGKAEPVYSYFIMLLLNNINDVSSFSTDELAKGIALLKNDLDKNKNAANNKASYGRYYALYDVANSKRIIPVKDKHIGTFRHSTVVPFIPMGFQYVRGEWVPSTGVGIEWEVHEAQWTNRTSSRYLRLYWEPLFDFRRDAGNKLVTNMNSFLAFKLTNNTKDAVTRNLIFATNFSIGYLVSRQGDLFEKNTIKFSLPGIQVKNVLLEPEFIFNKFFKNFSPSLKISLYFE
ncbi:MAG TPA: hypothetical protein VMY77_17210 [Chitinophagaceae bacterium]|nr:hypothetical protein [Chitinophagaceae bacterium]